MAEMPLEGMIMNGLLYHYFSQKCGGRQWETSRKRGCRLQYLPIYMYLQSLFCFSHHEKNNCVSLPRDHHGITSSRWRRCPTWCLHHSSGIQRFETQGWKATTCLRFDLGASWDCRGQPKHLFYKMEGWQWYMRIFWSKPAKDQVLEPDS